VYTRSVDSRENRVRGSGLYQNSLKNIKKGNKMKPVKPHKHAALD
jgi:hypothetical protein